MVRKILGKIGDVHIGLCPDHSHWYGLFINFSLNGGTGRISCNTIIANVNQADEPGDVQKQERKVIKLLQDAGVNYIDELLNAPVEVTIENQTFKSFRVLTEVL